MPGFHQEFGGSVSGSIPSTTVLYTICFRLLRFLSEKISAFLRIISHSALLMFYQELAQAKNSFQEMEPIHSMTFQAVHRSTANVARVASSVSSCASLT